MSKMDIRDIPIQNQVEDSLDIGKYAQALSDFIKSSDLPITISLQGEWGSGKSSLMNIISQKLCDESADGFEEVWINTWELSLKGDEKDLIERLSMIILQRIQAIAKKRNVIIDNELVDILENFKKYFFKTSELILSMSGADEKSREMALGLFDQTEWTHVTVIREKITRVVKQLVNSDNGLSNKGFIFFIDDLDRIEPLLAVKLMDVLKNLFVIEHCAFILAVDYEVIVKGLKDKYGEDMDGGLKSYRSYFDKLIQLPFVMPTKKYDIKQYVFDGIEDIGYLKEASLLSHKYQKILIRGIELTVGKNPRAIKRMFNAVKLSNIFDLGNDSLLASDSMKLANLLLISTQMAYPDLYRYYEVNNQIDASGYLEQEEIGELKSLQDRRQIKKLIDLIRDLFEYDEALNRRQMSAILSLSAMTHMSYDVDSEVVLYSGEAYDKSSETQQMQGTRLIEMIEELPGRKILDVGCGNGKTTIELLSKFPTAIVDAFDLSSSQIAMAKARQKEARISEEQLNFFQKDGTSLSYTNAYNMVFSNATLHWMVDAEGMYRRLYQALVPGGVLTVHQGGFRSYHGLHEAVLEAISSCGLDQYYVDWTYPVYYPTATELENLLDKTGFIDIEVISVATDGKEHVNLIDNFKKASLIPYLNQLPEDILRDRLSEAYDDICTSKEIDTYTHRLYVTARKG